MEEKLLKIHIEKLDKQIKAFSNTFDKDIFFPFQIVKNGAGLFQTKQ